MRTDENSPRECLKIVFLSHTAATSVFRVGSHHLSREMARAGHDVAHISTPVSVLHALIKRDSDTKARLKVALTKRAPDADGVTHIVPIIPAPLARMPASVRRIALKLTLGFRARSLRRRWSHADVIFADQPLLEPLARALDPRQIVYRPTDAHYDDASRAAELKLIGAASAVVAMSPRVLDEVMEGVASRPRTTYFENGVDYDRFAESSTRGARSGVIYLGALDKRFDWPLVTRLAAAFPTTDFNVVGPVTPQVPTDLPNNVKLRGGVPYEEVADILNEAAVGLLPFSSDPGNQGRSPMKYYEYLAAGLFVVATTSPTLAQREAPGVWLYNDDAQAHESIERALERASESENAEGRLVAAEHGWEAIAADMLSFALEKR